MKNIVSFGIGSILGGIIFCLIYGIKVIDPLYDSWLMSGNDLTQHYIGWIFFRNADWTFPIGLFDSLSYPLKLSITYLDSIPLMALFFKLFRQILPDTFQYIGIWGIMCFMLQGGIGMLILNTFKIRTGYMISGSIMIILTPVLLQRMFWHSALGGHWLILLSIYVIIIDYHNYKKYNCTIILICILATLIHPYLAAMVVLLFSMNSLYCLCMKKESWRSGILSIALCFCGCIFTLLMTGAFSGDTIGFYDGFGDASANLNSFINNLGHTNLGIALPVNVKYPEEGYAYLGAGVVFLLIFDLIIMIRHKKQIKVLKKRKILISSGRIMIILIALSPHIDINEYNLFNVKYPGCFVRIFNIFRSNGRFLWLIYYPLIIWAIVYAGKAAKRINMAILFLSVIIQMTDIFPVLYDKNSMFAQKYVYESSLKSLLWDEFGERGFRKIQFLSCRPESEDHTTYAYLGLQVMHDLAYYGSKNNMKLSNYYIAREDLGESNKIKHTIWKELLEQRADRDSLYIFPEYPDEIVFQKNFRLEEIDHIWVGRLE